jgi:hypothetical protein
MSQEHEDWSPALRPRRDATVSLEIDGLDGTPVHRWAGRLGDLTYNARSGYPGDFWAQRRLAPLAIVAQSDALALATERSYDVSITVHDPSPRRREQARLTGRLRPGRDGRYFQSWPWTMECPQKDRAARACTRRGRVLRASGGGDVSPFYHGRWRERGELPGRAER